MLLRSLSGAVVVFGVVLAPVLAVANSGGAPAGFAGNVTRSNGAPQTCNVCHSTFQLNSGSGGVTVTAPSSAGLGETIRITVTVDNQTAQMGATPRQGFEATVADMAGAPFGTLALVDPATTRLASGSMDYVTQTAQGVVRTEWQFDWTPDAVPRGGAARIYVAANAANTNFSTSGDHIYTTTADVSIATTATDPTRPDAGFSVGSPYPHPVAPGAQMTVDVTLEQAGRFSARVVDGVGRVLLAVAEGERAAGTAPLRVPTERLAAGTYFLVVEADGGRQTQPFVVAR